MKKAIIVYFSQTGNTELMAKKIMEGLVNKKIKTSLVNINGVDLDDVLTYDKIILGCPAMGNENLEEEFFEPFFETLLSRATNQEFALFGSYGWGNQVWIKLWGDRFKELNLNLFDKTLALYSTPTSEEEEECIKFGELIALN